MQTFFQLPFNYVFAQSYCNFVGNLAQNRRAIFMPKTFLLIASFFACVYLAFCHYIRMNTTKEPLTLDYTKWTS